MVAEVAPPLGRVTNEISGIVKDDTRVEVQRREDEDLAASEISNIVGISALPPSARPRPTILRAHARCSACTHTQRLPRLRVAAVGAGAITAVLGAASSILITLALGLGG